MKVTIEFDSGTDNQDEILAALQGQAWADVVVDLDSYLRSAILDQTITISDALKYLEQTVLDHNLPPVI